MESHPYLIPPSSVGTDKINEAVGGKRGREKSRKVLRVSLSGVINFQLYNFHYSLDFIH